MVPDDVIKSSYIMVVDDNSQNLELVEAILQEAGYKNVELIADPRQVITRTQERLPDAVLLDIRMPYLDGHQVLSILGKVYSEDYLPVIVLTAHADRVTCRKALTNGARDFLAKPLDAEEMLLRLRHLLETWHLYHYRKRHVSMLEQVVAERTAQLRDAHLNVILRLGRAGEYRDSETGKHVLRMSHYCQLLALKSGAEPAWAELMLYASPLHDVGKIGIPDHILMKPDKLTPEEREFMKRHVEIGMDILKGSDVPVLRMARVICETHHERWDGRGYLRGMVGENIPLEGRIAALCDVFDALTSPRPYKPAWDYGAAADYIRQQRGQAFDPRLVDIFLDHLTEFQHLGDGLRDS